MVNHTQDFVAVKKYEILQYSLIPSIGLDSTIFLPFLFVCLTFKSSPCFKQFVYFVKLGGMNQNNMLS